MRAVINQRKSGFTLVELLVVITVIGVLMSMAFPAYTTAVSSARNRQCGNNVRQIGTAYGNLESSGKNMARKLRAECWPEHLLPLMEQNLSILVCPLPQNQFQVDYEANNTNDDDDDDEEHEHEDSRVKICSYGMNSRVHRLSGLDANKVLALEYGKLEARIAEKTRKDNWDDYAAPGHGNMINVVFSDGSTDAIPKYMLDPSASSESVKTYWRPYRDKD